VDVNRLLRELLSVKVTSCGGSPRTGAAHARHGSPTSGSAAGCPSWRWRPRARAAWLVRYGEAQLPYRGHRAAGRRPARVASTDAISQRVHKVVEQGPEEGTR
jgi:trk system potassium uptake protein TrkA